MTTISVPIPSSLEESIKSMIGSGYATNKADVVRKALIRLKEEEAVNAVLEGEKDVKEGKIFRGDTRTIIKNYRKSIS